MEKGDGKEPAREAGSGKKEWEEAVKREKERGRQGPRVPFFFLSQNKSLSWVKPKGETGERKWPERREWESPARPLR